MSASKKNALEKVPPTSAPLTTTPSNAAKPSGYGDFLLEVKTQIRQRQLQALRAVNSELLALYWWLGKNISQRQAVLGWGKAVVENLAQDLQREFPGRNGFSAQNLWLMRQFVNEYSDKPKLQPLVGEISWTKNLLIMARCKDDLEREFYLRATARFGWTSKVLPFVGRVSAA
jgi:predicted nuclease of restriction endonuclease-like (RecB) superfamily